MKDSAESTSNTSESNSQEDSPELLHKRQHSDTIKTGSSTSETDSLDNSPRANFPLSEEETLYHNLQNLHLSSLSALWAENGPMYQALKNETLGLTFFKYFNPTIWLMHEKCQDAEALRLYLIDILTLSANNDNDKLMQLLHHSNQKSIIEFIKEMLIALKANSVLHNRIKNVQISGQDFIKLITELSSEEMENFYLGFKDSVARSLVVSPEASKDQVYHALKRLFFGDLKDYELFNDGYGYSNYQVTEKYGEKLDAHCTPYAQFNPIIQNINHHLADNHHDDVTKPINRWKTISHITTNTQSLQKSLDQLIVPQNPNAVNLVELQRQYRANYQDPIDSLKKQERHAIAEHLTHTHQSANQEIYKYLYFKSANQPRLAKFLGMPETLQPYDLFLDAASNLQNLAPHKQAVVNAITAFKNNRDDHLSFHANLKKIIIKHAAPKRGLPRLFAFIQTLWKGGEDQRNQYRDLDKLRDIHREYKKIYRQNHKAVTKGYINHVDTQHFDHFETIRTQELERLNALNQNNYFAANKTKEGFKQQLQLTNDPVQKKAITNLHRLSQDRRFIRDNIPGVIREFEQQKRQLAAQIQTTVTEHRKPANSRTPKEQRELSKQTEYTKTRLHRFMNKVERLRFKADINERILAQEVQPQQLMI